MKKLLCSIAALSFALAGSLVARAQAPAAAPAVMPPPNLLNIETDNVKAYEMVPYNKVADEYPALSARYKQPSHYLAMDSLTGAPRALYLFDYDSYETMQKQGDAFMGNAASKAAFDALDAREAPYTTEVHNVIWHYRPDLSNNTAGADLPHTHYWEMIIFHMKSGHDAQFDEMTKLYKETNHKIGQNVPWATYEALQGAQDAYLVLVPMTSLKDEDVSLSHMKDFGEALGEEGMHRMDKLSEEGVASVEDNLYVVRPGASFIDKTWIDADPGYWAPKPMMRSPRRNPRRNRLLLQRPHRRSSQLSWKHEGRSPRRAPFVFSGTQRIRSFRALVLRLGSRQHSRRLSRDH